MDGLAALSLIRIEMHMGTILDKQTSIYESILRKYFRGLGESKRILSSKQHNIATATHSERPFQNCSIQIESEGDDSRTNPTPPTTAAARASSGVRRTGITTATGD